MYVSVRPRTQPVGRQWLAKHAAAVKSIHAKEKKCLNVVFSMRFASYQLLDL
jgi:hypothetical protein